MFGSTQVFLVLVLRALTNALTLRHMQIQIKIHTVYTAPLEKNQNASRPSVLSCTHLSNRLVDTKEISEKQMIQAGATKRTSPHMIQTVPTLMCRYFLIH